MKGKCFINFLFQRIDVTQDANILSKFSKQWYAEKTLKFGYSGLWLQYLLLYSVMTLLTKIHKIDEFL